MHWPELSDDQAAEDSLENLNEALEDEVEALEDEAENPLTESQIQILEEPSVELEVNYDSHENLNESEPRLATEEFNEQITSTPWRRC